MRVLCYIYVYLFNIYICRKAPSRGKGTINNINCLLCLPQPDPETARLNYVHIIQKFCGFADGIPPTSRKSLKLHQLPAKSPPAKKVKNRTMAAKLTMITLHHGYGVPFGVFSEGLGWKSRRNEQRR